MSKEDEELARLQRLRDQQISRRKPTKQDKQLQKAAAKRKDWAKYSFGDALRDMPAKWLYMFIGGVIGLVIALFLVGLVQAVWTPYAAIIIVVVCLLLGRVFGLVEDWKHE
ncbi:MAG: hypothetical protein AAB217_18160 [Chloroflexota bacterium]